MKLVCKMNSKLKLQFFIGNETFGIAYLSFIQARNPTDKIINGFNYLTIKLTVAKTWTKMINAPYTAYIDNLPYHIEVEDVSKFFHGLAVRNYILETAPFSVPIFHISFLFI